MMEYSSVCCWAVLAAISCCASAFNIDIGNHMNYFERQNDSMFGFAVAQYKYNGQSRLLVGAPQYETEQLMRGVRQAGAVLQCSPDQGPNCDYVPFDRNGNNVHTLGQQLDDKSHQWFGATVRASAENGVVVACAPRYVWFAEKLDKKEPVGTCYVARRGLTDFQEFSPCRTLSWGYHRQGSCQAGFDAVITKDSSRMFIGAPGAFYWQGQIHSQSLSTRNDYQMTWEGPAQDDDQYLGYSVAVGDFTGNGVEDVALGVPKGLNYTGKIALYTHDLVPLHNISGYQLGAYFGYCLTTLDLNGDGLDDLLVGEPMYSNYQDREMRFEVGRVHVLLQNSHHQFRKPVTYTGEVTRGRFGLSVTALGDINKDGFHDFAVGAPYGGEDGNGAVFIYHGFKVITGELKSDEFRKPSQVIYSKDISPPGGPLVRTFGWSLSGGQDMDDNLYPDLLVGAYASNAATLLRARPIVTLFNHSLTFITEGKTVEVEGVAAGEAGSCQVNGRPVPCLDLQFCLGYMGEGVPEDLEVGVEYHLDNKVSESRLFFVDTNQRGLRDVMPLARGVDGCQTRRVYISPTLTDKLTPLSAEVSLSLVEKARRRLPRSYLQPILNQRQKLTLSDSVTIQKNCGKDGVCYPDLSLTVDAPDTFTVGQKEQLELNVRVVNDDEDAFEARVYIPVPEGLLYNKFVARDNTTVVCSPREVEGDTFLVCDIGNPLPMHKGVHFGVLFQQSGHMEAPRFVFSVNANSTNAEKPHKAEDNAVEIVVSVEVDTKLSLYGTTSPESVEYNKTLYVGAGGGHEENLGPEVTHTYGISNGGSSEITSAEVVILWPTRTRSGEFLLYLLEQPQASGHNIQCDPIDDVNPLRLRLLEKQSLKLTGEDESSGVAVEGSHVEGSYVEGSYSERGYVEGGSASSAEGEGGAASSSSSSSSTTYYSSSSGGGSSSSSSSSTSYSTKTSSSRTYSSSSSSYSTYSDDENELVRETRDAELPLDWDEETNKCGPTQCSRLRCVVGPLAGNDIIHIYVRSRLVVQTLLEIPFEDLSITSRMVARVTELPHGVAPDTLPIKSLHVTTPVSPAKSLDDAPPIPWWVIVLATMAGVLILLLIILVLWKCGYFKRNRPDHRARIADDAQPLNPPTNGHNGVNGHNTHPYNPYSRPLYPGDAAL